MRTGNIAAARTWLLEALVVFQRLGGGKNVDRVEQALEMIQLTA